jgi:alkyl sulfatase BDS1-like metallo-beta-lactamase superfamily hydrolase
MLRALGKTLAVALLSSLSLPALAQAQAQPQSATEITARLNAEVLRQLPFHDREDYEDAKRGFIAALPGGAIKLPDGSDSWNLNTYDFLKAERAPSTVNPSLWRIAQLNMNNGLFKVVDRIYQIRGFDLSNMTIIEGDTGLIVFDPLVTKEAAKAGMDLYFANRPRKPVVAVLYTHSHADHYGGVKGVVEEADVKAGKVKVIAPDGFLEEAISENVYAGNAMGRRTQYQYGAVLPRSDKGQLDAGLGKTTSFGEPTLIAPTVSIKKTGETLNVDGVEMVFQMAPNTEAPAEMLIYFPQFKALAAAEDLTHTMHNLYTLRGAQVRDAKQWWKTINEAIESFGDKAEVVFAQHHWPKWGKDKIVPYMEKQRDQFKYIHDQSLRLLNAGATPIELAEEIKLPDSLAKEWYNRGYYGSLNHNAKAIYQRYLGWYDSNPANLHPLPPVEAGKRYVDMMGGASAVIAKAKTAFDKGDYRWVAEVMKHVVFSDPNNKEASDLQANAFEQLGYQTEDPTWRNEYLMGAYELRNGLPKTAIVTASADVANAMTPEMLFDYLGIRLDGPKAADKRASFNMKFAGGEGEYAVKLQNGVLVYTPSKQLDRADATITLPKPALVGIVFGATTLQKEIDAGYVKLEGDKAKFEELLQLLVSFDPLFPIVTP